MSFTHPVWSCGVLPVSKVGGWQIAADILSPAAIGLFAAVYFIEAAVTVYITSG